MCLAIPAKVAALEEGNLATVDILGMTREISVDLTPQAQVGDYVLVHAGFAIEVVDADYAQETIDLIKQFPELAVPDSRTGRFERGSHAGLRSENSAFCLLNPPVYYTRLTARTSGLLLSSKGAAMYVSWMELLTFCLVIVAVIELTARLRQ